jgi:hypothetical protein
MIRPRHGGTDLFAPATSGQARGVTRPLDRYESRLATGIGAQLPGKTPTLLERSQRVSAGAVRKRVRDQRDASVLIGGHHDATIAIVGWLTRPASPLDDR